MLLPKCSAKGCRMWVWNRTPKILVGDRTVSIDPPKPLSNKCWWHAHGEEPPKDDDKQHDTDRG